MVMTLNKREQNTGAVISLFAITLLLMYIAFAVVGTGSPVVLLSAIGGLFLFSTLLCILVLRKYRKAGAPETIDRLNVGVQRYILALFMLMYGVDKLLGNFFDYQLSALDSKLGEVSEFQLAWFFYGKSRWQELFTGIMEFVPALFLFSRRAYYVAALALLPVAGQVFLLNLFFKIGGVTFPAAVVLLACDAYIIYSQKERLMTFLKWPRVSDTPALQGGTKTVIRTLRMTGIVLACLVMFIKIRPVVWRSPGAKKYQSLVGVYTLRGLRKNGAAVAPAADSLCYRDLYIEKQSRWNVLRRANGDADAFVLRMNARNDSMGLYINKGGTGDGPDIIDSATVLRGVYKLDGKLLTMTGIQAGVAIELVYERQDRIRPKEWFW